MRRKIYNELLLWKEKRSKKEALLIDGARRVGKSWIVNEFARNEYESYLFIDFANTTDAIRSVFRDYINDMDAFFMHLMLETGVRLHNRRSLIVFDEIQNFPPAREAIKYLVKDGRYDYIETGSLMSINANVKGINVPSEEHRIDMYPMDFEEFMWALGDDMMMDYVRECFIHSKPLGQSLHRKMMDYFRLYMIVGGMPQAVQEWVNSKDFNEVDHIKRNILSLYRSDISKYARGQEARVTRIFDTIPSQLQKHEKKFRLSALGKGTRGRNIETAFFWLEESRVVNTCFAASEPTIGLEMSINASSRKLYMADTGLLISHAFSAAKIHADELYRKLMHDKLEINKGMLVENIVAQMLRAAGHELYFFSSYSKTDANERMEVDFLIPKASISSRHNIHPIEVKSSVRYTLTSIKRFSHKYNMSVSTPIVLHPANVRDEGEILYLPLYMAGLL
ncbi:MAG: ATP-binding protein [Bacteroidales bacterium]|nr:ATP-binding protein [Candidatus Sodaliphilus fimicaballi]